jgi:hypothetical protein
MRKNIVYIEMINMDELLGQYILIGIGTILGQLTVQFISTKKEKSVIRLQN